MRMTSYRGIGNEWIENKDANRNEKQGYVVMRVMEVK